MKKAEVTEKKDIQERRDPEQSGRPQIFSDPDQHAEAKPAGPPTQANKPRYVKINDKGKGRARSRSKTSTR